MSRIDIAMPDVSSSSPRADTKWSRNGVFLILGSCFGVSTYWIFSTGLSAVLPEVARTFRVDGDLLSTPASLPGLLSGALIITAGSLGDRWGQKRLFNIGLLLAVVGNLLCVFAPSLLVFDLGRCIQGASAACVMPTSLALIRTSFPARQRVLAVSIWSISSWGGSGVSSIVCGTLGTAWGWQMMFVASTFLALISAAFMRFFKEVDESRKESSIGLTEVALLILSLLGLNLLLTFGKQLGGYGSVPYLVLAAVTVVVFVVFVRMEIRRGAHALINLNLFKNATFTVSTAANFIVNMLAATLFVFLPYLQLVYGFSPMRAAVQTLGYLVVVILAILIGGQLYQRVGARWAMSIGSAVGGLGILLGAAPTFLGESTYLITSFIGLAVMGLGLGLFATPSTDSAVSELAPAESGTGSGIYKMSSSLGGSFGIAFAGLFYAPASKAVAGQQAALAMGITGALGVVCAIFVLVLLPRKKAIQ